MKVRFADGTESTVQLGELATALDRTLVTADSPLGRALLGRRAGDTVAYETPRARRARSSWPSATTPRNRPAALNRTGPNPPGPARAAADRAGQPVTMPVTRLMVVARMLAPKR